MTPSECAAAAWIAGGALATIALQAATSGEHSVSEGLRAHPVATTILGVTFACHLARRPRWAKRLDPFAIFAPMARNIAKKDTYRNTPRGK